MFKEKFSGNNKTSKGNCPRPPFVATGLSTHIRLPWTLLLVRGKAIHPQKTGTQKIAKMKVRQKPSKFTLSHARPPTRSITYAMFSLVAFSISWTRLSAPQAVSSDGLNICRLACIWKCLDSDTDRSTELTLLQNRSNNVNNSLVKIILVTNRQHPCQPCYMSSANRKNSSYFEFYTDLQPTKYVGLYFPLLTLYV